MNICICSDGYPSQGLPYSAFIQVLAKEMVRQGCNIEVIAPQSLTNHFFRGGKLSPCYFEDSVQVNGVKKTIKVYRPYTITFGNGRFGKLTPKMNRLVTEFIIKRKKIIPDVFYAHFWSNSFNVLRISEKLNVPLFVATGEDKITIPLFLSKMDIKQLNQKVKGVICVSTKNMHDSIKLGLTILEKCIVLPNAFDNKDFYPKNKAEIRNELGYSQSSFIVAFCGRFNNRKGAMRVAKAINQLKDSDIHAIFIGSIADNETEIPDCDGILFRGKLPHKDISKYLNSADVFVLPSLAEGSPNSVIEAMGCGLPIITSDKPFVLDFLNHDSAMLIDPTDVNQIADAIFKLKHDRTLLNKLSMASLSKSKEMTIDKRCLKILNFIQNHTKLK